MDKLEESETDCSCGFRKLFSLTVFKCSIVERLRYAWETYLLGTKLCRLFTSPLFVREIV